MVFIIFFSVQYIIALTLFLIFFIIGLVLQSSFLVYFFTQSILKDGSKRIYHTLSGLLLWIISTKVCVIREPRYQRATSGRSPTVDFVNSSVSNTCERCTDLVDRSALLTGTTFAVTRPVEYFSHHTRDALEISARDCHLCNLLLRSIAKWSSGYGTTNVQSDRDEDLTIKVWEKREILGKPRLRVQVTARYGSEPLEIEELHYGECPRKLVLLYSLISGKSSPKSCGIFKYQLPNYPSVGQGAARILQNRCRWARKLPKLLRPK